MDEKSKKLKTCQVMQDEMKKLGVLPRKLKRALECFTKKDGNCTVKTVMDLVIECRGAYGGDEHFIATELFAIREQTEMFLKDSQIRYNCSS